jgi:hypothetical protein
MAYRALKTMSNASYGANDFVGAAGASGTSIISTISIHCNSSSGLYSTMNPAVKLQLSGANIWTGTLAVGETVFLTAGLTLGTDPDYGFLQSIQVYVDTYYNGDSYDIIFFGADNV